MAGLFGKSTKSSCWDLPTGYCLCPNRHENSEISLLMHEAFFDSAVLLVCLRDLQVVMVLSKVVRGGTLF